MDFVLVTNPRRRKKGTVGKGKNVSKKNADIDKELWSQEALEKKLAKNEDRFHVERYLKKIRSLLEPQALQFNHCLSLGLGRLHTVTASLQLQLFFELQSIFKIPSSNCSFYDPAFLEDDIQFLQNKGFTILRDSPKLECLENTLLYMPHCPTSLYEQWLDVYSRSEKQFSMCGNNLQLHQIKIPKHL